MLSQGDKRLSVPNLQFVNRKIQRFEFRCPQMPCFQSAHPTKKECGRLCRVSSINLCGLNDN